MDLGWRQSWFHPQGVSANSCPSAQTQTCCFERGEKKDKNKRKICRHFEEYDYTAVYFCTSALTSHRIISSRQALCGGLRPRKVAKYLCTRWFQFLEHRHHPALSVSQARLLTSGDSWLWSSEKMRDLDVRLELRAVHEQQLLHVVPTSEKLLKKLYIFKSLIFLKHWVGLKARQQGKLNGIFCHEGGLQFKLHYG